jgi:hypothetical protein
MMDQQQSLGESYSFSMATPAPDERRSGQRFTTLLRVGVLETGRGKELCLIRNISAAGLMAHVYSDIPVGTRAAIGLKSGDQITGTIVWSDKSGVGLGFDEPIDVADLLTACMAGPRPRMPRLEVDCFVSVRVGARTYRARTCDISQGGVKVKLQSSVPIGEAAVTLSGFRSIGSAVRWSDGELAGIAFNEVIPLGQLIPWLKEREEVRAPEQGGGEADGEMAA